MNKISVLIPTYNDEKTIIDSLDSIISQTYDNWEILICDDGSTDNTKKVVNNYIKKNKLADKISYYYQENADQLNAIINILNHATGDYVYIMHSDDMMSSENDFEKLINKMKEYDCDAIIGNFEIVNNNGITTDILKCKKYNIKKSIPPLMLLWLGRNLYIDIPFIKMGIFRKQMYNNYLLWNMPFWLNDDCSMLNVKNIDIPIRKYRVDGDNYLDNAGAKFNVINGELRTVTKLMKFYCIPFYNLQYFLYRCFNKLKLSYIPIYNNKTTKDKYKLLKFVMNKRLSDEEIENNLFTSSLLSFYKNSKNKKITFDKLDNDLFIYYGKDMRRFNKKLSDGSLEKFYVDFMKKMNEGFDEIIVDASDYDKMCDICKFMCIYNFVKIKKR